MVRASVSSARVAFLSWSTLAPRCLPCSKGSFANLPRRLQLPFEMLKGCLRFLFTVLLQATVAEGGGLPTKTA